MKKGILITVSLCVYIFSHGQNVGIGTTTPVARLHITDSNVVFTGPLTIPATTVFSPPIEGAGSRMMWYPQKAAFRVGIVDGLQWNKDSIGRFSFATGFNNIAKGEFSFASGLYNNASAARTTAMGFNTTASGINSTAIGYNTTASGDRSIAMGNSSVASGDFSTATGTYNTASGFSSTVMGSYNIAKSNNTLVAGTFNDSTLTNSLFEIGNGIANNIRSNAITVLQNGNSGLGTVAPLARLHVADSNVVFTGPVTISASTNFRPPIEGAGSRMMWYPQKAAFRVGIVESTGTTWWNKDNIGRFSFACGYSTMASGLASFAAGYFSIATGYNSTSMGRLTNATGDTSTAMGYYTIASGNTSTAMGYHTNASGNISTSMGYETTASGNTSTAMGYTTTASGQYSTAMGGFTMALGQYSTAMGNNTTASEYSSTTMGYGTTALGQYSTAMGYGTSVSGLASTVMGWGNKAKSNNTLVVGTWNDTTLTNRLFEIGNGTANDARRNAMTVLTNGNIGIGTTTPNALIQLANTITNRKIVLYDLNNNDNQYYGFGINGGTLRYQVDATLAAHVFYAGTSSTTSNELFRISGNGNAVLAGILTQNSDARLKKNIQRLQNPLQQIQQLNGYTYTWKDDYRDPELQTGLLAQEVQQVFPTLVKQNENGELSVNYMGLIPILIEGIKEQQKQNENLRREVDDLKQLVQQILRNK
ncbi:MAG TPA: tail fiber domain-containing protein [Chitinophagaceae bacterium]|nr:tail fiber domain-containing protein [Chitinophagaceae bacterium]